MEPKEAARPLALGDVQAQHPDWQIWPTASPRGYEASRRQSATAIHYLYGRSVAELAAKLDAVEGA